MASRKPAGDEPKKSAAKPKAKAAAKPKAKAKAAAKPTAKPTAKAAAKPKAKAAAKPKAVAKATPKPADGKPKRFFRRKAQANDSEQPRNRAERVLRDPEATNKLADEAEKKTTGTKGALEDIREEVKALIRLVRAYASGKYRAVRFESMVIIVLALIYLVSPIDVIPDFLPGGLIDDAAILAFALAMVHDEIIDFMDWEAVQGGGEPATSDT